MSNWNEITNEDIDKAIEEFNNHSNKYSKNKARTTFLVYEHKEYPAKAIRRIAYKIHFNEDPDESKFQGGEQTKKFFEQRGFEIIKKDNDYNDFRDYDDYNFITMYNRNIWQFSPGNYHITSKISEKFIDYEFVAFDINRFKKRYLKKFKLMRKGDILIINRGFLEIMAIGIIIKDNLKLDELNTKIDSNFSHFHKVKWLTTDKIRFNKKFFIDEPIANINYKSNEIVLAYLYQYPPIKNHLLTYIYKDYLKNFRNTNKGEYYYSLSTIESQNIKDTFLSIKKDFENGLDRTNDIFMKLLYPNGIFYYKK